MVCTLPCLQALNHSCNMVAMGVLLARAVSLSDSLVFFGVWFACGSCALFATRYLLSAVI